MPKPEPFPPLRGNSSHAQSTIHRRRREGAELFLNDRRYTREMHDRFDLWFQATAADLQTLFWSDAVENWFRQGNCWLVGSGSYGGIIETRDDRLRVLDELVASITSTQETVHQAPAGEYEYDICLSFAGEQRTYVEDVARNLHSSGVRVFYDAYEEAELWGKDLYEHLNSVYRDRARYCVIFVSREYAAKQWTSHERKSAQARAVRESREYILPARFDDAELPGLNDTVSYIDLRLKKPEELVAVIVAKLRQPEVRGRSGVASASTRDGEQVALEATWHRRDVRIDSDRHDYRLLVDIRNIGRRKVDEWRVLLELPNAFVPDATARLGRKVYETSEDDYSDKARKLYPGDTLHVLDVDYFVDAANWPKNPLVGPEKRQEWIVRIRISADGMETWERTIPMADLQNF